MDSQDIYDRVAERYTNVASRPNVSTARAVAQAFGYTDDDLSHVPDGANLGLSCGNPLALASLREGETVIDLGSGGGFDVFSAAARVGPSGRAIGIDMNQAMMSLARANLQKLNPVPTNIEFVDASITKIPLEDGVADCIISNCVVNLVPDAEKPLVFKEMGRLLKSGGRVAVSDILAKKELTECVRGDMGLWVGCIAGASRVDEYELWLRRAGFSDILITDDNVDLNIYKHDLNAPCCVDGPSTASAIDSRVGMSEKPSSVQGCGSSTMTPAASCGNGDSKSERPDPAYQNAIDMDFNEWVGSCRICAVKP